MAKQNNKIWTFNPQIYPRLLWVVITSDAKTIRDSFDDFDENGLTYAFANSEAFVFSTRNKDSGRLGVCVCFTGRKYLTIKCISHESVHVASVIFSDCNMAMGFTDNQDEAFAYMVGWAASCIESVKKEKLRDNIP